MPEIKYHIFVCNSEHSKQKNGHFCSEKSTRTFAKFFNKKILEAGVTEEVMLKASACMNQCINGITVKVQISLQKSRSQTWMRLLKVI